MRFNKLTITLYYTKKESRNLILKKKQKQEFAKGKEKGQRRDKEPAIKIREIL